MFRTLESPWSLLEDLSARSAVLIQFGRAFIDNKGIRKGTSVVILSYPRYCRYRALMKRLEGIDNELVRHKIIHAWGGIRVRSDNTRVLFCKDTFDYPELEGHELLCNHLAPKLKGRPRGKRKKRSISPGSESNESESSVSAAFNSAKNKISTEVTRNGLRCERTSSPRRSTRSMENTENKDFIRKLSTFLKSIRTPMGRIPSLGYKELDLHLFYNKVQKLGGYDSVTANRLWKSIFDDLSGNHSSTSAATVIRRHYERFLLAYERHCKGEEYKPVTVSERRKLKNKTGNNSASDAETSEGTSGCAAPHPAIPSCSTAIPSTSSDKQFKFDAMKPSCSYSSSLRSVRVKSDRSREMKTDLVDGEKKHMPEKNPEPVTGAVAPVQKITPEKSTSPAEGKENIPLFNARDSQSDDDDLIEVPYRPKTPEIIDLDDEVYSSKSNNNNNINSNNNNNNSNSASQTAVVFDDKKGKLDILKEGGLEVTPVRSYLAPAAKDTATRPSVIQDNHLLMPPPQTSLSKKLPPAQIIPKHVQYPQMYPFNGPTQPPRVVQSKSIYAPSQRTVYGDPKDLFGHQVQTPKFASKTPVTDLLDLTVRSPQKPVVEIMRVSPVPSPKLPTNTSTSSSSSSSSATSKNIFNTPALPLLEGRRINSNLEITLVTKPQVKMTTTPHQHVQQQQQQQQQQQPQLMFMHPNFYPPAPLLPTTSKRRSASTVDHGIPHKYGRSEENGRKQHYGKNKQMTYIRAPKAAEKTTAAAQNVVPKFIPSNQAPIFSHYPNQQQANKIGPYAINPMYMQAIQSMYGSGTPPNPGSAAAAAAAAASASSPLFPMIPNDRLMMQYARLPFNYALAQNDGSSIPSITTSSDNKGKKQ
ncbi:PREDICTED: uncharacterized protein LOC108562803 [Nicrophorus vespilloides]|uniref:Uncharacterized protein LOC108562803 n=1 Tax=Nicrophorus vespilloides TaxID=110193 RepID=A0ABM1MQ76_NICVS|nr:PREDICTED: uncharacterized protein LOC108562803 [Nicrophorus vespilloides]